MTFKSGKIYAAVIRKKLSTVQGLMEHPSIATRRNKLLDILKEKSERVIQSEIARKVQRFKGFYTMEMAPPVNNDDMKKIHSDIKLIKEFMQTGCFKFLTVKQAFLLLLVGIEIGLWFFLGETIGKMSIIGYKV